MAESRLFTKEEIQYLANKLISCKSILLAVMDGPKGLQETVERFLEVELMKTGIDEGLKEKLKTTLRKEINFDSKEKHLNERLNQLQDLLGKRLLLESEGNQITEIDLPDDLQDSDD